MNANTSLKSKITFYIDYIKEHSPDILLIQEAGPLLYENTTTPTGCDELSLREIDTAGYQTISTHPKKTKSNMAILIKKELGPLTTKLHTANWFIQAISIQLDFPILLINIHGRHNLIDYEEQLNEITTLTQSQQHKNIIIGGDFNAWFLNEKDYTSTKSKPTNEKNAPLQQFKQANNLYDSFRSIHPRKKRFTHWTIRTDIITRTRIDHFLTTKSILRRTETIDIPQHTTLPTDHTLITITIKIHKPPKRKPQTPRARLKSPELWPKEFWDQTEENLKSIRTQPTTEDEIEMMETNLTSTLQNAMEKVSFVPKPFQSNRSKLPKRITNLKKLRNALLKQKHRSLKAATNNKTFKISHSIISKSAKLLDETLPRNPTPRELNKLIRIITHKVSTALKKANQTRIQERIKKILEDPQLETKQIYKIIGKKKQTSEIDYYLEEISTTSKQIINDPDKVKNQVKTTYQNLYEDLSNQHLPPETLQQIPRLQSNHPIPYFTRETISNTIKSARKTAPGPDGITYEFLKTIEKNCPSLTKTLEILFQTIAQSNYIPTNWKEGRTILLPKQNAGISLLNWRPITLLNTTYKIFTEILNKQLSRILTENKTIPDEQNGFIPSRDTSTAIQTLLLTIKKKNFKNLPLLYTFIDFAKAFDSCRHSIIIQILKHINLQQYANLIEPILGNSYTRIATAYGPTERINFQKGVKQGDPLSPTLFAIYMLPIQWALKTHSNAPSHIFFADDLALKSTTQEKMKAIFSITNRIANQLNIKINPQKSTTSGNIHAKISNIEHQTTTIPKTICTNTIKYLGLEVRGDLNFDKLERQLLRNLRHSLTNIIKRKYLGLDLQIKLINTVALAKISYALNFFTPTEEKLKHWNTVMLGYLSRQISLPPPPRSSFHFWHLFRKVTHIPTLAKAKYTSTKIDRGLNSTAEYLQKLTRRDKRSNTITTNLHHKEIAQKLNLRIRKTNPSEESTFPSPDQLPRSQTEIWTCASIKANTLEGAITIHSNSHSKTQTGWGEPNPTNLELQAIERTLIHYKNSQHITIYSNSQPAINAITHFPATPRTKQMKSPNYHTLNHLNKILKTRTKSGKTTKLSHTYNQLEQNTKTNKRKTAEMTKLYGDDWQRINKGSNTAIKLANENPTKLEPIPLTHPGLPKYIITNENGHTLTGSTTKNIMLKCLPDIVKHWYKKNPRRSAWHQHPQTDIPLTTNFSSPTYANLFQKTSQNLLPTRKRMLILEVDPENDPPNKINDAEIYNNPDCNLCKYIEDSQEHSNSNCDLTLTIHNIYWKYLKSALPEDLPLRPWFTTTTPPIEGWNHKLGDRGVIPKYVRETCAKYPKLIIPIAHTFQEMLLLKWQIKLFNNRNNNSTFESTIKTRLSPFSALIKKIDSIFRRNIPQNDIVHTITTLILLAQSPALQTIPRSLSNTLSTVVQVERIRCLRR